MRKSFVVQIDWPDDDEILHHILNIDPGSSTPPEVNPLDENTSDGFHSFKELYTHRMLLTAVLFNCWHMMGNTFDVHKSKVHHDGEPCFGGGWFIVVAQLPAGQISYHYEEQYWDLFKIPEAVTPAEYDGHTPNDVLDRLRSLTS